MSFLTPLYIAGLAAIALPIVFHLIRRTPRGQTPFSSLMFLTPSPPRITRRSRLDQLLLLLLRGLALTLLALAFARPFFREALQLGVDARQGQRLAILVDASASMRRADLWPQAQRRVAAILDDLRPTDEVALFAFDDRVRTLVDFDDQSEIDPRGRATLVRQRLAETSPTWAASDLGHALAFVADRLETLDRGQKTESDVVRRIVLVSDLQQGARLDALQAYEWPAGVELEAEPLAAKGSTNAGLHLVGQVWDDENPATDASPPPEQAAAPQAGPSHRVRVTNAADSAGEQFELAWLDADNRAVGSPTKVYVPPGQSRILRVARPDATRTLRLVLRGDAHDFDNVLPVASEPREDIVVAYLGDEAADDPQGCRYYLERAFPQDPRRSIRIVAPQPHEPLYLPNAPAPRLAVAAGNLSEERRAELLRYLERGGRVLAVALDAQSDTLAALLQQPGLAVEEAPARNYALLGTLDFTHPLLAPFADPRYSDFTKIHFWAHRRLSIAEPTIATSTGEAADSPPEAQPRPDVRVLARFDNGDPALVERAAERGRLYVLTTSWRPRDSQLARSSKFVPLLLGMLGTTRLGDAAPTYVNQPLRLPTRDGVIPAILEKPDGTQAPLAAADETFLETDQPGLYAVGEHRLAVYLDPAESNTAPRNVEELEQFGVRLTGAAQRQTEEQRQRHLRDVELEGRQKVWQWLLAAALVVLLAETWLAGRQSHASAPASST